MSCPRRILLAAWLLSGAAACSHGLPDRARRVKRAGSAKIDDVPVKGFELDVSVREDAKGKRRSVSGELLAIDKQHLWLRSKKKTVAIDRRLIREVELELYSSKAGWMGLWTGLGTASALSHGIFFIFSGPTWLASGLSATIYAALSNDTSVPLHLLDRLYQYARFPAGMPRAWRLSASAIGRRPPLESPGEVFPSAALQPKLHPPAASRPASQPAIPAEAPSGVDADEPGLAR